MLTLVLPDAMVEKVPTRGLLLQKRNAAKKVDFSSQSEHRRFPGAISQQRFFFAIDFSTNGDLG
jgi:hypothetical protein